MLSAVSFLTVIGGSRPPTRSTMAWFPLVGALIGAVVAATHGLAHRVWPALVAGAVVVAVDATLTGALHLDGLADSADGLLPHADRDRRLAIMAEPTVGAFAMVAVVFVLMLRWAALAVADLEALAIVAVWSAARSAAGSLPAFLPYARSTGLAQAFLGGSRPWPALALPAAWALLLVVAGWQGLAAGVAFAVVVIGVAVVAGRRLGGFTGDVLGAVVVGSETAALVLLAAGR